MIRRVLGAVVMSVAVIALVGSATVAVEPSQTAGSDNGCHGIVVAYAHAADAALPALQAVAEKLGCDLGGVERVDKPAEDATETGDDAGAAGPDVQGKCVEIAGKLAAAQARPHGKSADALARQATRWGCGSN